MDKGNSETHLGNHVEKGSCSWFPHVKGYDWRKFLMGISSQMHWGTRACPEKSFGAKPPSKPLAILHFSEFCWGLSILSITPTLSNQQLFFGKRLKQAFQATARFFQEFVLHLPHVETISWATIWKKSRSQTLNLKRFPNLKTMLIHIYIYLTESSSGGRGHTRNWPNCLGSLMILHLKISLNFYATFDGPRFEVFFRHFCWKGSFQAIKKGVRMVRNRKLISQSCRTQVFNFLFCPLEVPNQIPWCFVEWMACCFQKQLPNIDFGLLLFLWLIGVTFLGGLEFYHGISWPTNQTPISPRIIHQFHKVFWIKGTITDTGTGTSFIMNTILYIWEYTRLLPLRNRLSLDIFIFEDLWCFSALGIPMTREWENWNLNIVLRRWFNTPINPIIIWKYDWMPREGCHWTHFFVLYGQAPPKAATTSCSRGVG